MAGEKTRATPWTGAMTVDVEEAFHAAALAPVSPRSAWPQMDSRVARTTSRILDIFEAAGAKATFFVLGIVAQAHPRLIRRMAEAGHEVASHGWAHYRVTEQTPSEFRADIARAKAVLEDAGGVPVRGYRAANFSLDETTWWAYEALAETGHVYSSSINPVRHDHYGQPDAPRVPFSAGTGVVEIPMTTVAVAGRRVPVSGGGWFRLLPYGLSRRGLDRAAAAGLRPIFYFHPWEIDPGQPRLPAPLKSRFRHYVHLDRMEAKITRLAGERAWDRLDHLYAEALAAPPPVWKPRAADAPREETPETRARAETGLRTR